MIYHGFKKNCIKSSAIQTACVYHLCNNSDNNNKKKKVKSVMKECITLTKLHSIFFSFLFLHNIFFSLTLGYEVRHLPDKMMICTCCQQLQTVRLT